MKYFTLFSGTARHPNMTITQCYVYSSGRFCDTSLKLLLTTPLLLYSDERFTEVYSQLMRFTIKLPGKFHHS